jgi:hypothetical protein
VSSVPFMSQHLLVHEVQSAPTAVLAGAVQIARYICSQHQAHKAEVMSVSVLLVACALALPAARAQVYMYDLGRPEPNWTSIWNTGSVSDAAISIDSASNVQVWSNDVNPGMTGELPLCRWSPSSQNSGHGLCRTDVAWLHSAIGIEKSLFSDPVANYLLRFHLDGSCYRAAQARCCLWTAHPSCRALVACLGPRWPCITLCHRLCWQQSGSPMAARWDTLLRLPRAKQACRCELAQCTVHFTQQPKKKSGYKSLVRAVCGKWRDAVLRVLALRRRQGAEDQNRRYVLRAHHELRVR